MLRRRSLSRGAVGPVAIFARASVIATDLEAIVMKTCSRRRIPALIVEAGAERFAIPLTGVLDVMPAETLGLGGPGRVARPGCRTRCVPIVPLAALLGFPSLDMAGRPAILVMRSAGRTIGLHVDRVLDMERVAIVPGTPLLRRLTLIGGHAVLRDGGHVIVLDPRGIARTLRHAARAGLRRRRLSARAA